MQALADNDLGNTTQRFTQEQLDAARGTEPMPARKIDLERFAAFGDRGTPPGMIGSNNARSALAFGCCGIDQATPVVRYSQRSSRSHRASAPHRPAQQVVPRAPEVSDEELERRLTQRVPVVSDEQLERRLTQRVPVVSDEELERRATRQMPAIPDDDEDEVSDELEHRFTRQVPVRGGEAARAADAPMSQQQRATSGPLPAVVSAASSWAPPSQTSLAASAGPAESQPVRPAGRVGLAILLAVGLSVTIVLLAVEVWKGEAVTKTDTQADAPVPAAASTGPELQDSVAEIEILEELEPTPAPEPEPEPEPKPNSSASSKSRPSQQEHKTAACSDTRARTKAAYKQGDWETVESLTRKRKCWSPAIEATRQRIKAQFELGKISACLKTGAGSKDTDVVKVRRICEALAR